MEVGTPEGGWKLSSASLSSFTSSYILDLSYSCPRSGSKRVERRQWRAKDIVAAKQSVLTLGSLPPMKTVSFSLTPLPNGLTPTVTFGLPAKTPKEGAAAAVPAVALPLLCKLTWSGIPAEAVKIYCASLCEGSLGKGEGGADAPTHIYTSSYQSWGFAGATERPNPMPRHALPDVLAGAFHLGAELHSGRETKNAWVGRDKGYYASHGFAAITSNGCGESGGCHPEAARLDASGGPALVIGFLSQRSQFGMITADKNLGSIAAHCSYDGAEVSSSAAGNSPSVIDTDFLWLQLLEAHDYGEEVMQGYLDAVAATNGARECKLPLSLGWCSWYEHYENINEDIISKNVESLKLSDFPANVVVVDDGYMTSWGDWDSLKPGLFPSEMKR